MTDRGSVIPLRLRKRARSRSEPRLLERPLLWAAKAALTFILIFPAPSWPRPVRSFLDVLQRRRRGSRPK
jgi:hypothetical protein